MANRKMNYEYISCEKPIASTKHVKNGKVYDYRNKKLKGVYAIINDNQEIMYIGQSIDLFRQFKKYRSYSECNARMWTKPIYGWLLEQIRTGNKVYFTYVVKPSKTSMFALEETEVKLNQPPFNMTETGKGGRGVKTRADLSDWGDF